MERAKFLWKAEPFLFMLFVLITAIPILTHLYFLTVDGPAHLHNANLLKYYWFRNNNYLLNFFEINSHLNSNFVDHVWFAVSGLFLPPFLFEKSILIFYIFLMPYSFRYLAKRLVPDQNSARTAAYIIFPFVYSFTFRIGFFNFCIGLPVLLFTLAYWISNREILNTKKAVWLTVLVTL